ncbi:MAG: 2-C-methyl-D-erythritol 2,4-cyclodiphosphate synthase [Mariprofundaceae bacterium]|nr:2-C-methyl-D-erythritol 2,4-cyclodiphosphate synthase [Mariprofundaceae bacterium]
MSMRIGQGFDVHAFAKDRALILGGVRIDYHLGLAGHSDADVLVHAICDALLGALALGDIGQHFPDTDVRYKGADSMQLLAHVMGLLSARGYRIQNLDATVIAQAPRLAPYREQIAQNIATCLDVELDQVSIKATTTEKLGFTGRKEGIAAQAVVLLQG